MRNPVSSFRLLCIAAAWAVTAIGLLIGAFQPRTSGDMLAAVLAAGLPVAAAAVIRHRVPGALSASVLVAMVVLGWATATWVLTGLVGIAVAVRLLAREDNHLTRLTAYDWQALSAVVGVPVSTLETRFSVAKTVDGALAVSPAPAAALSDMAAMRERAWVIAEWVPTVDERGLALLPATDADRAAHDADNTLFAGGPTTLGEW